MTDVIHFQIWVKDLDLRVKLNLMANFSSFPSSISNDLYVYINWTKAETL